MRNGKIFLILSLLMLAGVFAVHPVRADDKAAPAPTPVPAQQDAQPAVPAKISPGEQLMQELQKAYSVTLGKNKTAPLLNVAIIPSSNACQDFWVNIRDAVNIGQLRVRFYPAGMPGIDETQSARLLEAADPMKTWTKFIDGDKKALAGIPGKTAIEHVHANNALIDRWKFGGAPYLIYRAKNGQVKVVQGAPRSLSDIIEDMTSVKSETAP